MIRRQFLRAEHIFGDLHVNSSSKSKAANPKCAQPVIKMDCSFFSSQVFLAQATASWFPVPQSICNSARRLRVLTRFICKCHTPQLSKGEGRGSREHGARCSAQYFNSFKQVATNRLKTAPLDRLVLAVTKGLEASIALGVTAGALPSELSTHQDIKQLHAYTRSTTGLL